MLCGMSELTEIAYIRAQEFDVELVGVWDANARIHLDLPVWKTLEEAPSYDACLLTCLENTSEIYEELVLENEVERVFVPEILGLGVMRE